MEGKLHILLADDEEIVCQTIGDYLRKVGHQVDETRNGLDALHLVEMHDYDLVLTDVLMPGMNGLILLDRVREARPETPVVLITGHGTMEMAIQALRQGAADFLSKPVKLLELDAVLEKSVQIRLLRQDRRHLRETIRGLQASEQLRAGNRGLVGISPALCTVREQIRQAVDADCYVILITGETGTGKEVVAREIHCQAASGEAPFIAVCCPALPESLAESELFGHVKGAFTGATAGRAGYFELADGGTLFLDEIADLSPAIQAKMLRVLETRSFKRIGGSKELHVNVRVIAATNTPLEALIETGAFRRDLFYRLNAFEIYLPPLRERREDILPLASYFLEAYATSKHLRCEGFSPKAERLLIRYDFPGNARELRNLVERAAILCGAGQIHVKHLNLPKRLSSTVTGQAASPGVIEERVALVKALEAAHWNRRRAAKALGLPYSTLLYKMQKLRIE